MKCLIIILSPLLIWGQIAEEDLSKRALEILDTSTLNSIDPTSLWQVFNLSKAEIFALEQYKDAFGHITHESELFMIEGLDSTTAEYLLALFPIDRMVNESKSQFIHKISLRNSQINSRQSLLFNSNEINGAIHLFRENQHINYSGYLTHRFGNCALTFGDFSLHAGQGLLLGRRGFPSSTTSEYFEKGLKGRTGSLTEGIQQGIGFEKKLSNGLFCISVDSSNSYSATVFKVYETTQLGASTSKNNFSIFFHHAHGPARMYGELGNREQKIGANFFINDVLFETNIYNDGGLWTESYISWQNPIGRWNLIHSKGRMKLNLNNQNFQLFINEHHNETHSTWRSKLRIPHRKCMYEFHLHGKTHGFGIRKERTFSNVAISATAAFIDYGGHPIWLSIPAARGFIGAKGVYSNFAGMVCRIHWQGITASVQLNFENPSASSTQMSYYKSL